MMRERSKPWSGLESCSLVICDRRATTGDILPVERGSEEPHWTETNSIGHNCNLLETMQKVTNNSNAIPIKSSQLGTQRHGDDLIQDLALVCCEMFCKSLSLGYFEVVESKHILKAVQNRFD
ncbi:hypothetical protein L3X38_020771 [Prunus dulcis]|uniref:Uncharacterized protein n=1 Tax=Prunus dulcis TaxID=3755 RepID=A0AAD4ZCA9_PRUDU|nr:hypothetical protein L3X38_020771 [Prunus dulcis]